MATSCSSSGSAKDLRRRAVSAKWPGLLARPVGGAGEQDDTGVVGGVVVGEAGAVLAAATHLHRHPLGLRRRLGAVGIGHFEADVEDALALGVEMIALRRRIGARLAKLELHVGEVA